MITLYGIRNCDTMKKARNWLDTHRVSYTFHDYKIAGIEPATIESWMKKVGWETLLNRAGTTFRKLTDSERQHITRVKAILLMCEHPSMIKRPVLDTGEAVVVGFRPEIYAVTFP